MKRKKIVALGGDGIGPEVVNATCYILENASFGLEIIKPPCGEAALAKYHDVFPKETRELCNTADAVLFGTPSPTSLVIVSYLRWVLDNYVNVRPIKYYPGALSCIKDPSDIDFVFLRENSEGLLPGREGDMSMLVERLSEYRDTLGKSFADYGDGKFAIKIVSERGTRRFAKYACEYALQRKKRRHPGKVTCVHKSNALRETDSLFAGIIREEVEKYPELTYEERYVDNMAQRLLRHPKEYDVIVIGNMFGDILSDEASELVGGPGIAHSGCFGGKVPYFEPLGNSSAGDSRENVVNPTGTILSAKLMLDHLGMVEEADALEMAVAAVYKDGKSLTIDQGGTATTMEFAKAVLTELK